MKNIILKTLLVLFGLILIYHESKGQATIQTVSINLNPVAEQVVENGDTLYTSTVVIGLSDTVGFRDVRVMVTDLSDQQVNFNTLYQFDSLPQSQNSSAWKTGLIIYAVTIDRSVFKRYKYEAILLDSSGNTISTASTEL